MTARPFQVGDRVRVRPEYNSAWGGKKGLIVRLIGEHWMVETGDPVYGTGGFLTPALELVAPVPPALDHTCALILARREGYAHRLRHESCGRMAEHDVAARAAMEYPLTVTRPREVTTTEGTFRVIDEVIHKVRPSGTESYINCSPLYAKQMAAHWTALADLLAHPTEEVEE